MDKEVEKNKGIVCDCNDCEFNKDNTCMHEVITIDDEHHCLDYLCVD